MLELDVNMSLVKADILLVTTEYTSRQFLSLTVISMINFFNLLALYFLPS